MSAPDSIKRDLEFCDEHRELADLLIEHGCAPAGEDRDLLRALVEFMDRASEGRQVSHEGAFVRVFRAEMDAAAHGALVETYVWANGMGYGTDPALQQRGEAWAKQVEDAGKTWDVLLALARE